MKKISVAILICLVIVLTISLAGCSNQDVNKLFGEQKELAFSLQELTGLNVGEGAIMIGRIDDFGLAVFKSTMITTGKTSYSLFNFETNSIVETSTLEFKKINDGLYYQINEQGKYILTGASGKVVSGVKGSVNGKEFYTTDSNTTYYVAPDGSIKTSSKAFEERVSYGDTNECGDYQEKEVSGGYKYYTQQGECVGSLFPKVDFDLLSSAMPTASFTIANKKVFQYLTPTYDDNEKFDLYIEGTKCNLNTYVYDIKSGKSKEIKFNYYIADEVEEFDDSVILKVCNIVDKQPAAPYVQSFGFDVVGNLTVKVDLQKMLKGANEASITFGAGGNPQLLLSNTTDVSLFEDKECIFTISKGVNANVFFDIVMLDDKAYTLNGKLIIDEDVLGADISIDGKLVYSKQDKDDTSKIRYYIYDIAKDSEREITPGAGESVTFRNDYYKVGKKVYFYALERQVIDNVQSINSIGYYSTSDGSNKTIYKVTTKDGSEKYYVFSQYYK